MSKENLNKIADALGLMNSMILSGEMHSDQSTKAFYEAEKALSELLRAEQGENVDKTITYCGNPITTEDTCDVLAKKKTCIGCKWVQLSDKEQETPVEQSRLTPEQALNDIAKDPQFVALRYDSFCAFAENENAVTIFDLVCKAMKEYAYQVEQKGENVQNMEGAIESIKQITEDTPELNMVNYSHDQVCILNKSLIEIYTIVHQFKETSVEQSNDIPVEQSGILSAEEILKKYETINNITHSVSYDGKDYESVIPFSKAIKAMEAYHSQFEGKELPEEELRRNTEGKLHNISDPGYPQD